MTTAPTELKPSAPAVGGVRVKPNVYLSDVAMRIAVEMEAQSAVRATTVEKAEAICDILSALEPQAVDDAIVERAHRAQMRELFHLCQPNHGNVFAFMDDRKDVMRVALQAAKEPSHG